MLNKQEILFALSIAKEGKRSKSLGKLSTYFNDKWGIGKYKATKKYYQYSRKDIETLSSLLEQSGVDIQADIKLGGSRNETARQTICEKTGSEAVFPNPLVFKVINEGARINGEMVQHPNCSHIQIDAQDIEDIKAKYLVLVENLETFKKIHELIFDKPASNYLFMWRGGPYSKLTVPNTEKFARALSMRFSTPLVYLGDYDLKGLMIGIDSQADKLILPKIDAIIKANIRGSKDDYIKQLEGFLPRRNSLYKQTSLNEYFDFIISGQQSYTQERLSAFQLPHIVINLKNHD